MSQSSIHSVLEISDLRLPVRIGRDKSEREKPQDISFNITLLFVQPVQDEQTDHLEHSICYFALSERIQKLVAHKEFFLIEKLAFETLQMIKSTLPPKVQARVRVRKIKAPVPNLKGGVSYTLGDFFCLNGEKSSP